MRTTLVIMAAGIGSRFGGGIKQLAPVGLNGEIIMDRIIHNNLSIRANRFSLLDSTTETRPHSRSHDD